MGKEDSAQKTINTIRRKARRKYSAEEKIRIVMEGLKGEDTIAKLCRREGISESVYYSWSKQFLEAGKERLAGNTQREASRDEVKDLKRENSQLKELVAELSLKNRIMKKSLLVRISTGTTDALLTGREDGSDTIGGAVRRVGEPGSA
jgi:transposase